MRYADLLSELTVDSKDNGLCFQITDRLDKIRSLLMNSSYAIVGEGDLSLVYAKAGAGTKEYKTLISTHIDCVYTRCFFKDADECHWIGTFDNSATNAAVIDLMLQDTLDTSVIIAFTGDEEKSAKGAVEVMRYLSGSSCQIDHAVVLDVTNEGWEDEAMFTIENDRGFDILAGYQIVGLLQESGYPCNFLHKAEPDETWEYGKGLPDALPALPCLSLCLPVEGDMHGEAGVRLRKTSILPYQEILMKLVSAAFL